MTAWFAETNCPITAAEKKTISGEDILGFENYAEALKIYLSKYREVSLSF
jgi:hypothetical protein